MSSTSLLKSLVNSWKYLIFIFLCTLTFPLVLLFLISDIDFENIDVVIYIFGSTYLILNSLVLFFIFRKKIRVFSYKQLISGILFLIFSLFTADMLWYASFGDFLHEFGLGILLLSFICLPQISYLLVGIKKLETKVPSQPAKPSLLRFIVQTVKIGISLSPIYYCITYADFSIKEDIIFTISVGTFGLWLLSKIDYSIFIYLIKSITKLIVSIYKMAFSKEPTQIVISIVKEDTKPLLQPKPKYESFVFYRSPKPAQIEPYSLTWTLGSEKLNNKATNTLLRWVGISPKIIKHKTFWTFYSLATNGLGLMVEVSLLLLVFTQYIQGVFRITPHILLILSNGIFVLFQMNKYTLKDKLNIVLLNIDKFKALNQKTRDEFKPSSWVKLVDKILKIILLSDLLFLFLTAAIYFIPPALKKIDIMEPFITFSMGDDLFFYLLCAGFVLLLFFGWLDTVLEKIAFLNKAQLYSKSKHNDV